MNGYRLVLLLSVALFANVVVADLRVTVRFDQAGHRIFQVFRSMDPASAGLRAQQAPIDAGRSLTSPDDEARAIWFDSAGRALFDAVIRDPRIIHAPVEDQASAGQVNYAIREQGIYRLRGPDAAVSVRISLPAMESVHVQLPGEEWILNVEP